MDGIKEDMKAAGLAIKDTGDRAKWKKRSAVVTHNCEKPKEEDTYLNSDNV